MPTALAIETNYEDVLGVIRRAVRRVAKRCPPNMDEKDLYNEGVVTFVRTYLSYHGGHEDFPAVVYRKVMFRLLDHVRRQVRRYRLLKWREEIDVDQIPVIRSAFDVGLLLSDLSEDAGRLVRLVLGIKTHEREAPLQSKTGDPVAVRAALKRHANERMGWGWRRFVKAFKEVQGVLT